LWRFTVEAQAPLELSLLLVVNDLGDVIREQLGIPFLVWSDPGPWRPA
jgi:hypothetical protein